MFKKVALAISGGVDSAIAGYLLKSKGFEVTAVFMRNWNIVNEVGVCQTEKDFKDAEWVCKQLQIPLQDVNFEKDYWNNVFNNLLESYETGKTPNPDIYCNKKIKFDKFFYYAMNVLGVDAIATGHYAKNSFGSYLEHFNSNKNASLLCARDLQKDQTLFLSQISQESLRRTMFPLGDYIKEDVKRLAKEVNLDVILNKKESMGICFIGKRKFKDFISEYIENKPGEFIDFRTGRSIGKHNGIHQWTLGQGCRIGGRPSPYFVFRKDIINNNIYVVAKEYDYALNSEFLVVDKMHWINNEPDQLKDNKYIFDCLLRFQHRHPLVPCKIFKTHSNKLLIQASTPLRAVTSGQFAVLYFKQECLGSAEILNPGPSHYFLQKSISNCKDKEEKVKAAQSQ